jgi:peptide methionine sulfoxide reductase msrA/msrB
MTTPSCASTQTATFAGGCFWCMEPPFESLEGVTEVVAGYAGGTTPNPTYHEVAHGQTDYAEAVQVTYNPKVVSYDQLLITYWRSIDPTQDDGQFADIGKHYRTIIFYHDDDQHQLAIAAKQALSGSRKFDLPIVTQLRPYTTFHLAEDYHQDYYKKSTLQYNRYKKGSGRDSFLKQHWPK